MEVGNNDGTDCGLDAMSCIDDVDLQPAGQSWCDGIHQETPARTVAQVEASSRLSIFPFGDLGKVLRSVIAFGTMKSSRWSAQNARSSGSLASSPCLRVTKARMEFPRTGSGTPITAASATLVCEHNTFSTSRGLTFSPRVLMMSSLLPTKYK